ncbi:MAG: type II toxin-antitoxin system HicB family antitoxin [Synechococcus sp. SB0677_bin_5]|nr:type II toxin-antitoxin system HicB family antitoxin [Synechococcus sp. SB0677_bin_5]
MRHKSSKSSRIYTVITTKCTETGGFVGCIPNFPGAYSQEETLEELNFNMKEVISMLNNDESPVLIDKNQYVDEQTFASI